MKRTKPVRTQKPEPLIPAPVMKRIRRKIAIDHVVQQHRQALAARRATSIAN